MLALSQQCKQHKKKKEKRKEIKPAILPDMAGGRKAIEA